MLKMIEERDKKKARKLDIIEGALFSGQTGFGDYFFTPFGLTLGASSLQIGLMNAFRSLLSPISEILGIKLMEHETRKNIVSRFVLFQALSWILIISLALLYYFNILRGFLPLFFIVLITFYFVLDAITVPSWFSWIGDIVPDNARGKHFGYRSRIAHLGIIITSLIGAYLLDFFKSIEIIFGFVVIFTIAMIFRVSCYFVFKSKGFFEPKYKVSKNYYFSFFAFVKRMPKTNFGKFVIFMSLINLTLSISMPFFSVYLLKDLNVNYKIFTLITLSSSIAMILFFPIWGRFSDKYGNEKMLSITSYMIPIIPLLWIFSRSTFYLIFPQILLGVFLGGFSLAANNFIYDSVKKDHRGLCVAYYSILSGAGIFIGALIGGLIINYIDFDFNKFYFVFILSAVLSFIIALIFLNKIQEVRKVKTFSFKSNYLEYENLREMEDPTFFVKRNIRNIGTTVFGFFKHH